MEIIVGHIVGSDREDFVSESSAGTVPPKAAIYRLGDGKSLLTGGRGPKARRAFADPVASCTSIASSPSIVGRAGYDNSNSTSSGVRLEIMLSSAATIDSASSRLRS